MRLKNVLGEGSGERMGQRFSWIKGLTDDGKRLHGAGRSELKLIDEIEETRRGVRGEDGQKIEFGPRADGLPKVMVLVIRTLVIGDPPK